MLSQSQARMLKAFRETLARLAPRGRVLAAVSGGPDSMALLHLLFEHLPSGRLAVAHINHRLRGRASDADERFVRETAKRLGLRFLSAKFPKGRASEEALRKARYRALEGLARKAGAVHLATGHTAEDQAETILLRLARGTGLAGLSGMPESRPLGRVMLVRPLLGISREDLAHYLKRHGIRFRIDASNKSLRYARNRVRGKVLPELKKLNPRVVPALLRLSTQAAEAAAFLETEGNQAARRLIRRSGRAVRVNLAGLGRLHPALRPFVWQVAYARLAPGRSLDADHLSALARGKGEVSLPGRVRVVRAGRVAIIRA